MIPRDTKLVSRDTKLVPRDTKLIPRDTKFVPRDTKLIRSGGDSVSWNFRIMVQDLPHK